MTSTRPWRGWVVPIALLCAAELAMRIIKPQSDALAAPSQVLIAGLAVARDGSLWRATGQTLLAAAIGLLIGALLGLAFGIWTGLSKPVDRVTRLSVELSRPIPAVALMPLALLVFGFGIRLESSIVAFATFFPMLILTRNAIRTVETRLLEVARVIRLSQFQQITKILLPAAVPRVVTALRLCISIALVVAVTVEVSVNPMGLGYALMIAQQSQRPDLMLAYLLWIGLLGFAVNTALVRLQVRFFTVMAAR